jgi:hypothetical protein
MIARVMALFSPGVYIPQGEEFQVYDYEGDGYKIRVYPPQRSGLPPSQAPGGEISINGVPGVLSDMVRLDFIKDSFERREGFAPEPSDEMVGKVVNSFLLHLRFVTRGAYIRPLNFPYTKWNLSYLKDDGSPLEPEPKLSRGRGYGMATPFSWIVFNKEMWAAMHQKDAEPPPWDGLLLDASIGLPNIGAAIVLAATTLEVFIEHLLDKLATHKGISSDLWSWLTDRGDYTKNPHVEEKFDILLKVLTGHSLKEDQTLWKLFKELKTARNTFVHDGIAKLGGKELNEDAAKTFVDGANRIIAKVREWTPQELQWPEFKQKLQLTISMPIG